MLSDQELQTLRNLGNECEAAADEIERLRRKSQEDALQLLAICGQADEHWAEVQRLRAALAQALDALRMPCDRWNKRQSEIVNAAIKACEAELFSAPAENNGSAPMELFSKPQSTSTGGT